MRVRINSPGGSVFEGIAIANALRAHPATVTVQVDGIAASIASVIAMAGDRVEMAPNSMLMIHEASGVCMGDMAEMTKMAEVLDLISTNIANAYADRVATGPGEDVAAGTDAAPPEAPVPAATQPPTEGTSDALDEWAQHIARLTPPPDPWAADIARLTSPASSSATES
jgi:hypothetical protein